jgi:D-xylose transport system substrate-binding protein
MKSNKGAIALIGTLALFATACGSSSSGTDTTVASETTIAEVIETTIAAAEGTDTTVAATEGTETTVAAAVTETTVAGGAAPAAGGKAGFILPDSKSSVRWETADRPMIEAACAAAAIECDIQNAEGDAAKMATIADAMIAGGVKVLALVNLDSPSAAAIHEKAAAQGVKLIDYDRLTLGGKADVYVSFDNVAVGKAQGEGLIKCLGDKKPANIIQLSGSPTDNNATLFKQGQDEAIKAAVDAGDIVVTASEAVPGWDNVEGGKIFEQLLTKSGGKTDGVLAANDGLSLAAQTILEKNGLTVPATGQDASVDGLASVLKGTQCMTVYKPVKAEAEAAVKAAAAMLKGEDIKALFPATINNEAADIAFTALPINSIFKDNVKDVVTDGYVTKEELCKGDIAELCTAAGI